MSVNGSLKLSAKHCTVSKHKALMGYVHLVWCLSADRHVAPAVASGMLTAGVNLAANPSCEELCWRQVQTP
jgi:hypothetical protein